MKACEAIARLHSRSSMYSAAADMVMFATSFTDTSSGGPSGAAPPPGLPAAGPARRPLPGVG